MRVGSHLPPLALLLLLLDPPQQRRVLPLLRLRRPAQRLHLRLRRLERLARRAQLAVALLLARAHQRVGVAEQRELAHISHHLLVRRRRRRRRRRRLRLGELRLRRLVLPSQRLVLRPQPLHL